MSVAQRLYEGGYITYMRTDSTTLSDTAVNAARTQVRELYGPEYLPDAPRTYASQGQERPGGARGDPARRATPFRTPGQTGLTGDQFRLYELVWQRTVASQMKDADRPVGVGPHRRRWPPTAATWCSPRRVGSSPSTGSSRRTSRAPTPASAATTTRSRCPSCAEGEAVNAASLTAQGHETKPPARYTEATLIKELEDREIGRPSTYASIIGTIINRGYVYKKGSALVPAWIAFSVVRLLEEHFPRQIDYEFTAKMEDVLDEIAAGQSDRNTELAGVLLRLRRRHRPAHAGHRARRDRRQGARDVPGRRAGQRHRAAGRALRALPRGSRRRGQPGRQARQRPRRPAARRADAGEGARAVRDAGRRGGRAGVAPRHRPDRRGEERPLRPVRHRGPARGRQEVRPAAHRLAVQVDDDRHHLPRRRGQAADACRASSATTPRASRSPRRTAGTGPTSRRAPTPAPSPRRSSCSPSPRTRRWRSTPSPSSAAAAPRPRR